MVYFISHTETLYIIEVHYVLIITFFRTVRKIFRSVTHSNFFFRQMHICVKNLQCWQSKHFQISSLTERTLLVFIWWQTEKNNIASQLNGGPLKPLCTKVLVMLEGFEGGFELGPLDPEARQSLF